MHQNLTEATGGRSRALPTWSLFKSLLTLHPLGGCPMGASADTGVVDHLGRVYWLPEPDRRRRRDRADADGAQSFTHDRRARRAHRRSRLSNRGAIDASIPQGIARAVHLSADVRHLRSAHAEGRARHVDLVGTDQLHQPEQAGAAHAARGGRAGRVDRVDRQGHDARCPGEERRRQRPVLRAAHQRPGAVGEQHRQRACRVVLPDQRRRHVADQARSATRRRWRC